MNILAIDVGTQSLKASVIDSSYNTIERKKYSYQPHTEPGNRVDIEAEVFWNAIKETCQQLKNKDVCGIVFSTLCPSLLLMDSEGNPLTKIILHLDRRSGKESDWIIDNIGLEKFRSISGNPPIPGGISVTSMLWIKEQFAGQLPNGSVFGHAITFFMKKLTGKFYIDPSNASFTGLYNTIEYSDWSDELLEKTGIERKYLPEVLDSFSIAGTLEKNVAAELGLAKDIPVVIGANDTTCAVTGVGISEPGMLLNTCGTVELLVLCSDKPIYGSNHLIRTHAYKDRWLLMRTLGAGGASIEWFRSNFYREISKEDFYKGYIEEILNRDTFSDVVFEPYLTGDRHKLDKLTASFRNITIDTDRDAFFYSIAYSNAQFILGIIKEWEKENIMEKTIYHVGGGAGEGYTNIKRKILPSYDFVNIGETAEKGAAIIGFKAIEKGDMRR